MTIVVGLLVGLLVVGLLAATIAEVILRHTKPYTKCRCCSKRIPPNGYGIAPLGLGFCKTCREGILK